MRMSLSKQVEQIVQAASPGFWVPAVGNQQLGELLLCIEEHNLWDAVRQAVQAERDASMAETARLEARRVAEREEFSRMKEGK